MISVFWHGMAWMQDFIYNTIGFRQSEMRGLLSVSASGSVCGGVMDMDSGIRI